MDNPARGGETAARRTEGVPPTYLASRTPRMTPRTWKKRLAALGLSAVLCFLGGELLIRSVIGAPLIERLPILTMRANPARGWQMVPDEPHYTYQHRVEVNSLGLRGPQLGPREEREVRVLALGDSLVYGQGVADDETLPHHLERVLEETDPRGRPWTVVNAGHRAYDTHQELRLLEELGEAIDPDVVVLFWFWNDFHERNIELTNRRLSQRGEVTFDTGWKVEGRSWWIWHGRQYLRRSALLMFLHDVRSRFESSDFTGEELRKGMGRLEAYLRRFRALGAERDFEFVMALVPDPNAVLGPHQSAAMEKDVTALAESMDIPVLPLHDSIAGVLKESGRLPILPFDGHYASPGNEAMAADAAAWLLRLDKPSD